MKDLLDRPVFVIGAGRSGTTIFFDLLSHHPDFGYFTNYDDILCNTPLFGITRRLFENNRWQKIGRRKNWKSVNDYSSLLPRKTEAYRFWRRCAGHEFTHGYLWTKRPDETSALFVRTKLNQLMHRQHRKIFAAKLTGPGRIAYLKSVFPNARFIHLVRDARAQIHSTLNVGFWKAGTCDMKLWWSYDLPDKYRNYLCEAEAGGDPLVLAAAQWRTIVESIRDEANTVLSPHTFKEISYEEFVCAPVSKIVDLWNWLGLELSIDAQAMIATADVLHDNNTKWRKDFGPKQLAQLARWLERPVGH